MMMHGVGPALERTAQLSSVCLPVGDVCLEGFKGTTMIQRSV